MARSRRVQVEVAVNDAVSTLTVLLNEERDKMGEFVNRRSSVYGICSAMLERIRKGFVIALNERYTNGE